MSARLQLSATSLQVRDQCVPISCLLHRKRTAKLSIYSWRTANIPVQPACLGRLQLHAARQHLTVLPAAAAVHVLHICCHIHSQLFPRLLNH